MLPKPPVSLAQTPPPDFSSALKTCVLAGDTLAARRLIDSFVFAGGVPRIDWSHLATAAQKKNVEMARLLITWGARPQGHDLPALFDEDREAGVLCSRLLKRFGFVVPDAPAQTSLPAVTASASPATAAANDQTEKQLSISDVMKKVNADAPDEWFDVLKAFQKGGATDAVIAGGALRDTFNDRAVKDVDIFMTVPKVGLFESTEKAQRKMIAEAFTNAGLTIEQQIIGHHYGPIFAKIPKPDKGQNKRIAPKGGTVWSWNIQARKSEAAKIENYNIIFMPHDPDRVSVIETFDLALCQISMTDRLCMTIHNAFLNDVKNKTISLSNQSLTSPDHLKRIIDKYPDFTPSADVLRILKDKKTAPKSSGGYFDY